MLTNLQHVMDRSIPGLDDLQINNIFCIGRNYALHAREMSNTVPGEPIVFLKPNSSVLFHGGVVVLPAVTSEVQHEVELVAAIGKEGKNIPPSDAELYIAGVGVGIDLTARQLQHLAKKEGKPWTVSKGFDTFAPISAFVKSNGKFDYGDCQIELKVNGFVRQQGYAADMIFSIRELISYLSSVFTLQPGDLLFTGTPEGVGPVESGDRLVATLNSNLLELEVHVQ